MGPRAVHVRDVDARLRGWVVIVLLTVFSLIAFPTLVWACEKDGGAPTDEAQIAVDIESARVAGQNGTASADAVQIGPEDEAVALESCDAQSDGDVQGRADEETATQTPDEGSEQTDSTVQEPEKEKRTADIPDTPVIGFSYVHDPRDNPRAMADIIEDVAAIYGFRPSADGSLAAYAGMDWTDPVAVEGGRRERIAYHESIAEMYEMLYEMQTAGATTEQIARAVSAKRNEIRIASYANNPEGLARLKARNLELYGNENGGTPEYFYERYGSWEEVIDKSFSTNSGMDACLGLYDDYYKLYVILGQVEPDPVEPGPAEQDPAEEGPVEPDPAEDDSIETDPAEEDSVEDDETDVGEKTDDRDDGSEADDSTDESQAQASADENQTHAATMTSDDGRRTLSASVRAVSQTTQTLPATGDVDVRLSLDLTVAGGILVGLGVRFRKKDIAA